MTGARARLAAVFLLVERETELGARARGDFTRSPLFTSTSGPFRACAAAIFGIYYFHFWPISTPELRVTSQPPFVLVFYLFE